MDIGLVLTCELHVSLAQLVSILILVDIGLVHINVMLDVQRNAISLNPYSCGYRTGTASIKLVQRKREVSILILVDIGLVLHSM